MDNLFHANGTNNGILYTLKGTNGQLYVYEDKIEISRKGFLAFAQQGAKGTKTIPISQIKSVQVKPSGFMMGFIQFGIGGSIENKGDLKHAHTDENSVTFSSTRCNALVNEIKNYIEAEILKQSKKANMVNNMIAQNPTNSTLSVADELKKFKELLDMGAITQEEFDAKKKELLGL